jgi:hypothetical protein
MEGHLLAHIEDNLRLGMNAGGSPHAAWHAGQCAWIKSLPCAVNSAPKSHGRRPASCRRGR